MSNTEQPGQQDDFVRELAAAARYYLADRRVWIGAALLVMAGGLALNWDWLVAIGMAPLLLAVLPCAVMCALGVCMIGGKGRPGEGGGGVTGDQIDLKKRISKDV